MSTHEADVTEWRAGLAVHEDSGVTPTQRGEVIVRQPVCLGTSTSVPSVLIVAGLLAGTMQTSSAYATIAGHSAIEPQVVADAEWKWLAKRQPRTALGQRLMQLRERIVRSGTPLLGWNEIEREVAARRGEEAE